MRKKSKRILSFLMVLLTVITTVFGHVDYNVYAEEMTAIEALDVATTPEGGAEQITAVSETQEVTITPIAEALAGANGTTFTVKGVVTLVDGKNIYVQDATGAICVYMSEVPTDITLGDTIIGTGKRTAYSGLEELGNGTYVKSEGLTLTATETTLGALTKADVAKYVTIKELEVTAVSGTTITVTDKDKTTEMPIYKAVLGDTKLAVGDKINFTGAVGIYNTLQLRNTLASEIVKISSGSVTPDEPDTDKPDTDEPAVEYNTVAEALAGANDTVFTVKGVVTLVDSSNIYVQDSTGGICVRMSKKPTDIALGDTIIGTGKKSVYNGLPQLGSGTYEKSEGLSLAAKETTLGALVDADIATYVTIKNLSVTNISGDNVTVTDGTNSIKIYKGVYGETTLAVGDKINFTGAVGIYNTLQLRNTLASEIVKISSGSVTPDEPDTDEPAVEYNTVEEALAGANDTVFTVKGVVTLVDGQNIYVQDATGGICVRMSKKPTDIALGDTIVGTGSKTVYNGLPQLGSGTYEKSEGLSLTAKTTTIGALTTADIATYVELKNVEVTEVYDNNGAYSSPNITVKDTAGKTIQLYKAVVGKTDGAWDVAVGDKIDVKAAVSAYNTTLRLRNTLASEITEAVVVKVGKVTSAAEFTTGTYVMVAGNDYAPGELDGKWVTAVKPTIIGNAVSDAKGGIWTLTVSGNTVKITDSKGQTIAPTGGNDNGIKSGSYDWAWSFDESTQTFTFAGQGSDTVKLASNFGSENKFRGYKNSTLTGSNGNRYSAVFTLYRVDPNATEADTTLPTVGSSVVIYNVAAAGVLAAQDDNAGSPSVNSVLATVADKKATAENGGVVFEVKKNGDYFRFYNETYGYLSSNGTGSNAYYSFTEGDEADWTLESLGEGFLLKSKAAKFVASNGNSYPQYLEYYADSYKTYSFYNNSDTSIYEFHFYECANTELTGGIVNKPAAAADTLLDASVGMDYTFDFTINAPFGVKEVNVTLANEALTYTENAGIYTVSIPSEKISGEKLSVIVSGKDNKDIAFSNTFEITVVDVPSIQNVTPAHNSETDDNKKPVISAEIVNAGTNPTITMKVNNEDVNAVYANGVVSYTAASDMADGRYSVTVTVTREDGESAAKTWAFNVGKAQYQLYYGQLHSHTTYSDGSGSLASALEYIKNLPESANVDFVAFTDHSNYFDASGAANPENSLYDMSLATPDSQTKWNSYKGEVAAFNASQSDVVAIAGFEMTWSGGPGHMNTFNSEGIVSRNNTVLNNKTNDAGMKAYYALLSQPEGAETLNQFNHPGSTFGTFADFAYWDAVIDTRIQLVEVGNGEGQVGAGGYFPSYEYYTMALDKGWHVAPTNNQDNHKGKWGNANDARDVVLTDDFSEEGIYQAISEKRVYATEDKNLEIYYTLNGLQLGSSLAEKPENININVVVNDPDAADSISKVEVIVNSGKVAYTWNDPAVLAKGELTCTIAPDYSYYYIRVTEGDGDLAVTAPVWVGEPLKLGISSVECGTSTPVTKEELTLTSTLFNSETVDAAIKALTYTVNGGETIGTDTTGYTIPASGTKAIEFKYTPTVAKVTKITVTAIVELEGIEYTFTMDVTLDVEDAEKLAYIGIDAAHYNEYVAGNYKDSMGNFGELAAGYSVRTVELKTCEDLIAACSNSKYKALILTAPSRRLAESHTDPRTYSEAEIAAIKAFNEAGGTVIISGWSDHYEDPSKTGNNTGKDFIHMAATQNAILEALGSSLRMNDDATYDDSYNGGQQYRLYFNTYGQNFLTEGVEVDPENPHDRLYTEVFSHYGGASVYTVGADGQAASTLPATVSPVVFGHSSTYSVDADNDGIGGASAPKYTYAEGDDRIMVMAMEELDGKGAIIVSGAAFMSNFEVQAEIEDSGSEKNYANYKICENLVQYINPTVITPIATVQAQTGVGYKYTIEGVVTSNASGYDKDTAFFDCIYVQDETGGICCFPVAGNYKIGDKVRITGTTEFYQGEMELQVTSIEVIGTGTVTPKNVTAAQINDKSVLGQLVTVKGTITSFEVANGLIQTIMVKDEAGNTCRVFIDGYITIDADVANVAVGNEITVIGLASYDDTFNAPTGPFPRIRIRDRKDIVCTTPVADEPADKDEEEVNNWWFFNPSQTETKDESKDETKEPVKKDDVEISEETVTVTEPTIETSKELVEDLQQQTDSLVEAIKAGESVGNSVSEETYAKIVEAIEAGEEIVVKLVVDAAEETSVPAEDMAALKEALAEEKNADYEVLQYFDISVLICTSKDEVLGKYEETSEKLTFTIAVPTDMLSEGKEIVVIRIHNGEVSILDTVMNQNGTVSFQTDRFSTYALAYKADVAEDAPLEDVVSGNESGTIETPVASGSSVPMIIAIIVLLAAVAVFAVKKAKKK